MNPLAFIGNSYLRWRHSLGFGVHSPFAYNLVKTAVSPGDYGYYGYDLIDDVLLSPDTEQSRHIKKDARLLLRLLVALGSNRLFLSHSSAAAFHAAAEGAGVKCLPLSSRKESPQKGDFVLIEGNSCDVGSVSKLLKEGVAVMAIGSPSQLTDCIENGISHGVVLTGTRIVLGVPREEMALVKHSMWF